MHALPEGWKMEPEPDDGMLRITPGSRASRQTGLVLAAAGAVFGAMAGVVFTSLGQGAGGWRGQRLTLLAPLGLLLIGYGLWLAFGREEWRAGADLLEVRHVLFGLRRVRRFRGATLRLVGAMSGGATRRQRSLDRAARTGGSRPTGRASWWGLYVADHSGTRCLASSSRGFAGKEALEYLGERLSERTGWPLILVRPGRKG